MSWTKWALSASNALSPPAAIVASIMIFATLMTGSFTKARKIGEMDQTVLVHCENALICDELGEEAKREGRVTAHDYVASRPVFTEVEAIRRVLYLAKAAGCRLHVCHISSPEGVEEVTRARQEGQDVTCESCPHYFVLDTDQFEEIGTLAKCSPPIRDQENQKGMWENCLTAKSTAWYPTTLHVLRK